MNRSEKRILTTHVGSLPRPSNLVAAYRDEPHRLPETGRRAEGRRARCRAAAARHGHRRDRRRRVRQAGARGSGLRGVDDLRRLAHAGLRDPHRQTGMFPGKDREDFHDFYCTHAVEIGEIRPVEVVCTGPVRYTGQADIERDLANFRAALGDRGTANAFVPMASPTSLESLQPNEYYKTQEEYAWALAEAMKRGVRGRGQGRLHRAGGRSRHLGAVGFLVRGEEVLRGIPALCRSAHRGAQPCAVTEFRRSRSATTCAGAAGTGRMPTTRRCQASSTCCSGSGPVRTASRPPTCGTRPTGRCGSEHKLPEGRILIPGVVTHSTNLLEPPELVADRIVRYAKLVGRENVIAGTDCGLGGRVHPSIAWAKLRTLAEGAELASKQLWG